MRPSSLPTVLAMDDGSTAFVCVMIVYQSLVVFAFVMFPYVFDVARLCTKEETTSYINKEGSCYYCDLGCPSLCDLVFLVCGHLDIMKTPDSCDNYNYHFIRNWGMPCCSRVTSHPTTPISKLENVETSGLSITCHKSNWVKKMCCYETVSRLNNIAISLFQSGCHEDALISLKAAINELVGNVGNQQQGSSQTACASTQSRCYLENKGYRSRYVSNSGQESQKRNFETIRAVSIDQPECTRELDHATSMYSYAVVLSEDIRLFSSEACINQASVVLLYNLAFMHHWRAVYLGISSGLVKALQMYELVVGIIQPKGYGPEFENLVLAVWNNMGHVHSQLFQLNQARACFDRLRLLLVQRDDILVWLPKKDYETFFLSAMFQGSDLHLAPAA